MLAVATMTHCNVLLFLTMRHQRKQDCQGVLGKPADGKEQKWGGEGWQVQTPPLASFGEAFHPFGSICSMPPPPAPVNQINACEGTYMGYPLIFMVYHPHGWEEGIGGLG